MKVCLVILALLAFVPQVVATTLTPEAADKRLRELRKLRGGSELSFQQVSELAARLSDDRFAKLAQDIGVGRTDGMRGWVRAAVFAEWSRRDFDAAMKQLSGAAHLDSGHQQALYAVFRGSRPQEPVKALFHLQRMFQDHPSAAGAFTRIWAKHALKEIFSDLAAQDPDRAWKLLTWDHERGRERVALEFLSKNFSRHPLQNIDSEWIALSGFFAGLPDLAAVQDYAARFEKGWNTPEVAAALKKFNFKPCACRARRGWRGFDRRVPEDVSFQRSLVPRLGHER